MRSGGERCSPAPSSTSATPAPPRNCSRRWSIYLDRDRRLLLERGEKVIVAPELASG
ncbi:hypothetical protein H4696_003388 [Amycolatopsis lexingtonensis]|uniref:Uncharacterized protein n=1 Tax=Amycolatopsis lexingtonensis TaxID=218822 RepID=A0ABR9HZC0_9PSEU|nr:hypothetical protein [Amycolatopsis lexingtonensis]MBE1496288.1 hypothetical protein [Amycolatopsis lexingtonensis]